MAVADRIRHEGCFSNGTQRRGQGDEFDDVQNMASKLNNIVQSHPLKRERGPGGWDLEMFKRRIKWKEKETASYANNKWSFHSFKSLGFHSKELFAAASHVSRLKK
jgi:hypothetical protein